MPRVELHAHLDAPALGSAQLARAVPDQDHTTEASAQQPASKATENTGGQNEGNTDSAHSNERQWSADAASLVAMIDAMAGRSCNVLIAESAVEAELELPIPDTARDGALAEDIAKETEASSAGIRHYIRLEIVHTLLWIMIQHAGCIREGAMRVPCMPCAH
jgi:hypothetical protein